MCLEAPLPDVYNQTMKTALPPLMTDELPLRIEPAELADADQLRLTTPGEIQRLLLQLCEHHELVSLYVDDSDQFGLSMALAVDQGRLILDLPHGHFKDQILAVEQLYCTSALSHVKVQFTARSPRLVEWQGKPALAVTLPTEALRLQRRDFYRLIVPLAQPLSCYVPLGHGEDFEISLADISVGGIGIIGYVPGLRMDAGRQYHGIRIELPDTGTVMADVEMRSSFEITLKNGIHTIRTGAQFIHLSSANQTLIQRYITKVERERIAKSQRLD